VKYDVGASAWPSNCSAASLSDDLDVGLFFYRDYSLMAKRLVYSSSSSTVAIVAPLDLVVHS